MLAFAPVALGLAESGRDVLRLELRSCNGPAPRKEFDGP
jgi:hypothetical protein